MSSSCGTDAGKTALRGEYMATRTTIPAQVKLSSDARIQLQLESFDLYRDAPLVLTYVSYDSEVDTQIVTAIDEHLRAIDRLCRFGIDGGFGEKYPVKEH